MKGLLLKDLYMMRQYCRTYLLIIVGFVALSIASEGDLFFLFYPCMLCGMIPANLLAYDENSRWLQYSGTMPYTKEQLVSSKYILGCLAQIVVLLVIGIAQAVRMIMNGTFSANDYILLMLMVLIIAMISPSISLPLMFKLGVEKGRVAYYVMIGIVVAGSTLGADLLESELQKTIKLNFTLPFLCLAGIGIFVLSWHLSIVFFRKREIY